MAKAAAKIAEPASMVEEFHFRSENAFLCLLVNHRTKLIRVIDFRAGALPAKRLFIQSVAKRAQIEKVITLVEKDEVSSWTRVGFVREGTIPGFYKRSDGHLCGCVIGEKTASVEVSDSDQRLAERTVNHGKKAAKNVAETVRGLNLKFIDAAVGENARDAAWKKGETVNTFDPFGRGAERIFLEATLRKNTPVHLSAEFQDCFGHSLVEVLRSPATDNDIQLTTASMMYLCEHLKERGIVSAFAFAPSDNESLATMFLASGFRKTGLLARGIQVGKERRDAILWTRKLANPGEDDNASS